jgi:hypothetical protein
MLGKNPTQTRKQVLPYAFPISVMLEIEQTSTRQTTSKNQFMTGI